VRSTGAFQGLGDPIKTRTARQAKTDKKASLANGKGAKAHLLLGPDFDALELEQLYFF